MLQELSQFDWSCEFFFDMPNFFSAPLEGLSNLSDAQKHCFFFVFVFVCVFVLFVGPFKGRHHGPLPDAAVYSSFGEHLVLLTQN